MKKYTLFILIIITSIAHAFAAPLNSFEKIQAALDRKEITAADAAGLRVLAYMSDPAIPAEFLSDRDATDTNPDDLIVDQARVMLPEMTEGLAIKVYGHMIPPPYRSTQKGLARILDFPKPSEIPSSTWVYLDDVVSGVRVWYEKDNQAQFIAANRIRRALEDAIIPAAKKLMGRTHPADDVANSGILVRMGLERAQPNGGDGKLDVYLFKLPLTDTVDGKVKARAWVQVYDFKSSNGVGCPVSASYMAVDTGFALSATPERLASTVAHEYFHVIQNTYPRKADCVSYHHVDEGTATYFKDYVFPNYNHEHEFYEFFEKGTKSLIGSSYDTWYFYYFMTRVQGTSVIPKLHELRANETSYDSIEKALDGGFKEQWPDFAVYNWNQDPLQDGFKQWDKITYVPKRPTAIGGTTFSPIKVEEVELNLEGQYSYDMSMILPPLTRDYFAFDVRNEEIHSVAIDNPVIMNAKKVKVKVLIRKRGHFDYEEVTWEDSKRHEYQFCLDNKEEAIDQIVIVVANYNYKPNSPTYRMQATFKASNQGCHRFNGKMTGNYEYRNGKEHHVAEIVATDLVYKESGRNEEGSHKGHFHLESANVSYTYSGLIDECRGTAAGHLTPDLSSSTIALGLYPYNVAPEAWGDYVISVPLLPPSFMVHYVCPPPRPSFSAPFTVGLANGKRANHGGFNHLKDSSDIAGWKVSWDVKPIRD